MGPLGRATRGLRRTSLDAPSRGPTSPSYYVRRVIFEGGFGAGSAAETLDFKTV